MGSTATEPLLRFSRRGRIAVWLWLRIQAGGVMKAEWRNAVAVFVVAILFPIWSGVGLAFAQQTDLNAILKRFNELYAAGNYDAALVEGQKLEVGVKAQFGTNHTIYAAALNN